MNVPDVVTRPILLALYSVNTLTHVLLDGLHHLLVLRSFTATETRVTPTSSVA